MSITKIQSTIPAFKAKLKRDENSMNLYRYYRRNDKEDTFFKIVDIMDKKLPQNEIYEIETVRMGQDRKNLQIWKIGIKSGGKYCSDPDYPHTENPSEAVANLLEKFVIKNLFA